MDARSLTRGRVVLVPFPFDDLSATKVPPAVCLTDPIGPHRHVVPAFITSRVLEPLSPSDLALDTGHPDFADSRLRVNSTLRLHRLMTVSTALIQRQLGILSPGLQAEVDARLRLLIHLR